MCAILQDAKLCKTILCKALCILQLYKYIYLKLFITMITTDTPLFKAEQITEMLGTL